MTENPGSTGDEPVRTAEPNVPTAPPPELAKPTPDQQDLRSADEEYQERLYTIWATVHQQRLDRAKLDLADDPGWDRIMRAIGAGGFVAELGIRQAERAADETGLVGDDV